MNFSKPLRNLGNSYACVGFSLERDEDRHGASESCINVGMDYLVSETHVLSPLTPLRGEGAANGHHYYSFGVRHSYDGVQRTARPTKFGSWPVSRSEGNRELSMILFLVLSATPAGVERVFWRDRSGGIAALNLRLLSLTPPVSRKGIPGTAGFVPGPCQKMTVRDKTGHRQ